MYTSAISLKKHRGLTRDILVNEITRRNQLQHKRKISTGCGKVSDIPMWSLREIAALRNGNKDDDGGRQLVQRSKNYCCKYKEDKQI